MSFNAPKPLQHKHLKLRTRLPAFKDKYRNDGADSCLPLSHKCVTYGKINVKKINKDLAFLTPEPYHIPAHIPNDAQAPIS